MKKNKILSILFLLFTVFVQKSYANTDLLQDVQDKYQQIQTFTSDFTQELYHKQSQHTQNKSGVFSYQKESNIHFEYEKPHEELLVVNTKEIWNYIPDEEIAYKYNASLLANSNNIFSVITGKSALNSDFEVEFKQDTVLQGKKVHSLVLYPLGPTLELTQAELLIDVATKLILQAKIYDFYGNTNTLTFSNVKLNTSMSKSLFVFTPPKGIDIEDNSNASSFSVHDF